MPSHTQETDDYNETKRGNIMTRRRFIIAILSIFAIIPKAFSKVKNMVFVNHPSRSYKTIGEAIDSIEKYDNDVIYVMPGHSEIIDESQFPFSTIEVMTDKGMKLFPATKAYIEKYVSNS